MKFVFVEITDKNFHFLIDLFEDTFGKKIENNNLDLVKKFSYDYLNLPKLGSIAFDEKGNVAGALCLFPVNFSVNNVEFLGAQIGDAMVKMTYRKQNLFTQLIDKVIEQSRNHNIKCLFTFPNVNNVGSYKGFLKTKFIEQGVLYCYKAEFKPSIKSRLLRKISLKLFYNYQKKILNSKKSSYDKVLLNSHKLSISRNPDYLKYKTYKNNWYVELNSGFIWLSIGEFSVGAGDYFIKNKKSLKDLVEDLIVFSKKIGKDNILFFSNYIEECNNFDKIEVLKKNTSTRIMKFSDDQSILNLNLFFNYADIDTF